MSRSPSCAARRPGLAYKAQRTWSNKAALAGHDPCQPHVSSQPYFNSVPRLVDAVTFDFSGQSVATKGVHIPVGSTRTLEIDLFSEGATSGPWSVSAVDVLTWVKQKPELTFSFDRNSGVNGEKVHLSITVLKKDPTFGAEFFAVVSTLGDQQNIWYGTVGN